MAVNSRNTNAAVAKRKPKLTVLNGGAHSNVVGGSTAKIRLECAGSMREERKSPRTTNVWADRGTALHHVVETALNEDLTDAKVLREFTGVALKIEDMVHTIDLTADLLRAKVLPALRYFDETLPKDATYFIERKIGMVADKKVSLPRTVSFEDIADAFGTGDVFFASYKTGRAGAIDWKFGDGIMVDAADNDQGRFYLCLGILNGLLPVQDEYEFHIFQPVEGGDWDAWTKNSKAVYTLKELQAFNRDLADAVHAAKEENPVYNPGEHCAKCNGRITCKAFMAMQTLAIETDVEGMSGQQLARALDIIPAMNAWIKDIKSAALRNAQNGVHIPTWMLESSLGDSEWVDAMAAVRALGRKGVPANVRMVAKPISPTQAIKHLKDIGTPEVEIERFKGTHVQRPNNGEKLVKAKGDAKVAGTVARLGAAVKAMKARGL